MISDKDKFIAGIEKLANVVGSTLGPKGQLVTYRHLDGVRMTKDGVTASKFVEVKDETEQMGIEFARAVADKVVEEAGDGTTTATVLTWAFIREAQDLIKSGKSPKDIVDLYQKYYEYVDEGLRELSQEITPDKIYDIATVSANDPELANLIVQAVNTVGQDGLVDVVDGYGKDRIEHVDGINWDRGYISEYMVTDNQDMVAAYRNPKILMYNGDIVLEQQARAILQYSMQHAQPVVVVCNDLKGEAANMIIYNVVNRGVKVCVVKAPGVGKVRDDFYMDIGVMTNSFVYKHTVSEFHENFDPTKLGSCEKFKASKSKTVMVNPRGNPEDVLKRVNSLKQMFSSAKTDYDKEIFQERIGRLANKVVLFHCAGSTKAEIQEKKDRIEDALKAIRESLKFGYLPGGGSALFISGKALKQRYVGGSDIAVSVGEAFERATQEPLRRIAKNAGHNSDVVVDHARSKNGKKNLYTWNAVTDKFETIDTTTIVDPTSVTLLVLKVAVDTASMVIRTSYVLVPEQSYQEKLSHYAM